MFGLRLTKELSSVFAYLCTSHVEQIRAIAFSKKEVWRSDRFQKRRVCTWPPDIPQVDEMNIECGWGKLRARIEIAP